MFLLLLYAFWYINALKFKCTANVVWIKIRDFRFNNQEFLLNKFLQLKANKKEWYKIMVMYSNLGNLTYELIKKFFWN